MHRLPAHCIEFSSLTIEFAVILLARNTRGVCSILLGDTDSQLCTDLQQRYPQAQLSRNDSALAPWLQQVTDFLAAPMTPIEFPVDIQGTDFQKSVWAMLQDIPVGETRSYSEVAQQLGRPKAVRAVANACAANPLALIIPCHRILRADGGISGYRWGVERKRAVLAKEKKAAAGHSNSTAI